MSFNCNKVTTHNPKAEGSNPTPRNQLRNYDLTEPENRILTLQRYSMSFHYGEANGARTLCMSMACSRDSRYSVFIVKKPSCILSYAKGPILSSKLVVDEYGPWYRKGTELDPTHIFGQQITMRWPLRGNGYYVGSACPGQNADNEVALLALPPIVNRRIIYSLLL